jgi:hypothetical protein
MSVLGNKRRPLSRKAYLRATLAPFMAACIGVLALTDAQANTGSNFYDYLEQGYLEIATYASREAGDAAQSKHFTGKAQLAAAEAPVEPDQPKQTALPQKVRLEMEAARQRLDNALAAGAQEIDPLSTAVAQVNLDCWLAQFGGAAQAGSDACRLLFYSTIAKLPTTVATSPYATLATEEGQLSATGGAPISAVGGPTGPTNASAPGPVGGVISAVGGPLQGLGADLDDAVASLNGSANGTVDDTSDTASNATGGAIGGVADSAGGAVGGVADGVGGALADAGDAVGGALGGGGLGGLGGGLGGLGGGGGLGGLGGGLGGGGGGGGLGGLGGGDN